MLQKKITLLIFCFLLSQLLSSQSNTFLTISADGLQEDVHILEKTLKYYHPGIYRYNTEEEIDKGLADLRKQFSEEQGEASVLLAFAKFANQLQCGHTYTNPWNMDAALRKRFMDKVHYLPFGFQLIDQQMVITRNVSNIKEIQTGTIIQSINGIPVERIIDSLLQVTKADGLHTQAHRLKTLELDAFGMRDHQIFDMYFPLFFPMEKAAFEITYQDGDKTYSKLTPALSRADRMQKMEEKYGKAPVKSEKWDFYIDENQVAVVQLSDFAIWSWDFDYKKWMADAFQQIKDQNAKGVVIDIRGNSGGLSEVSDELLTYLVKEDIQLENTYRQVIRNYQADSTLWPYLDGYDTSLKNGLPREYVDPLDNGMYQLKTQGDSKLIQAKALAFSGPIFFVADATNSSATFSLLSAVQSNDIAKIVGEPGGGNKQGINGGSYFFLRLPNSKMEIDIPLIYYQPPTQMPDESIQPDISVKTTIEDIVNGKDAPMEKIKELMKEK